MRYAISAIGNEISQHFGRCTHFVIVDIEDGNEVSRETMLRPDIPHSEVPPILAQKGVTRIVTGGMGTRAQNIFQANGVETILGAAGDVDAVIEALRSGEIESKGGACDHGDHQGDHHHHGGNCDNSIGSNS